MNPIKEIFSNLTDLEVKTAIHEIHNAEETGIFEDTSLVKRICRDVTRITGVDMASNLMMVQIGILKEGSYRWINSLIQSK